MEEQYIVKSSNDKREYRFLTLANELKVVLISSMKVYESAQNDYFFFSLFQIHSDQIKQR